MVKAAVLFDLDDTLYDTTHQVTLARRSAIRAMVASGMMASEADATKALEKVVSKEGPNYQHHYDDMLRVLGLEDDPKIVASGIVAYHEAKRTHLIPYPDTIPTLLALRRKKYKLGVVTDGLPVKQWEKLIRLGLANFFDTVVVESDEEKKKPSTHPFLKAATNLKAKPEDCMMVGDRLDRDVVGGKKAGMATAYLTGGGRRQKPTKPEEEPDYIITRLDDLMSIL
ncbi:MAG: TIGR02253 family HAD-type hydrolase [Candidatus Altiarchaeota archaeon]